MRLKPQTGLFSQLTPLIVCCACLMAFPSGTPCQDSGDATKKSPQPAGSTINPPQSETVIVTAQKEQEPAHTLPVSVTAVTENTIMDAGIVEIKQAADYVPNAFINEFTARALHNPYFRGIGGSPTNPGVSTFIDGVPQLNSYSANQELTGVGQLEFLRGPEGALYGRNTAGGLINISSAIPAEKWTANGEGNFGNYNLRDVRVYASGPLYKDRLSMSLSGGYSARDGYTKNDSTGNNLDSRQAGFGKGQLLFNASERLKVRLIFSAEHDSDGDFALGDLSYIRTHPNRVNRDFEGYNDRQLASTTLVADYHGHALDFTSISGGGWWKNHGLTDLDYSTATLANYGLFAKRDNVEQQNQFTQEFRFASSRDRVFSLNHTWDFSWQGGLFLFKQNYKQDASNDISSAFGFFPPTSSRSTADLDDWGLGVYGQGKFTALKKLDLTAGVRFDYEDKSALTGSLGATRTSLSASFSEPSPQFRISYRFTPNQMPYISIARGYRAGGFNPPPTGVPAPAGAQSYGTEHTWNYEAGHKAMWASGKLETNLAFFYIDWQNLQLNQQIPFSGGQYYIGNAGAAHSKGVEAETKFRPFSWWELFGDVGYTHATFGANSTAYNSNLGMNQNIAGNRLPYTPTFNANVGTQASWSPCRAAKIYLRVQVTLSGDFQYDASNAASQTGFSRTDVRAGIRLRHWFAEGWANNAANTHYVPIAIPYAQLGAPSGYIGETGAPRTFGLRAGFNF